MTTLAGTVEEDGADFFGETDYSATNQTSPETEATSEYRILRLAHIEPSPLNPRKHFDDASLSDLAESIKAVGVTTPIMVRQKPDDGFGVSYEIIMGERRYRAAKIAGLTNIPAIVRHDVSDSDLLGLAITENIKRSDLTALEEAAAYQEALRLEAGLTQRDLAKRFGISQPTVANALRLLQLPEAVRLHMERGSLSRSHGVALASLSDQPEPCIRFALQAVQGEWPVSQLEAAIREYKDAQEAARQPRLPETQTSRDTAAPASPKATGPDAITKPIEPSTPPSLRTEPSAPSQPLPEPPAQTPEIVTTPAPVANPEPTLEGAPSGAVLSAPAPARQVEATKPTVAADPGQETVSAPAGPRIATSISESDDDWLFEADLTLDTALAELRSYRLSSRARTALGVITSRINAKLDPSEHMTPAECLEMVLVTRESLEIGD